MHSLLQEMLHYKNGIGSNDFDPDIVSEFENRYDEILEIARIEYENEPPSDYYREGYNLYRRLVEYKDSALLFLHDKRVPSNNSLAERLARTHKRKQRQAIVFRSKEKHSVSVQQAEQIREASRLPPLKVDASPGGFRLLGSRSAGANRPVDDCSAPTETKCRQCFALLNSYNIVTYAIA